MPYELYYWPTIQGRGEFVRLALEQAGADYIDVARGRGRGRGGGALHHLLADEALGRPPFAVPALRDGEVVIGQTAAILLYLGPRLGLAPEDEAGRIWTHQIQLTIGDLVEAVHNTHHPVGSGLYYEEQKAEAARAAEQFRRERLPRFLGWLETILGRNQLGPDFLVQDRLSYADLSAFQAVEGLRYAFPRATEAALERTKLVPRLCARVRALPRIAAYLGSDRRIAFSEQGIFRRYPELDEPS